MFYVNDDHRTTQSSDLLHLASEWFVSVFHVLQTPTTAPMTIDAVLDMRLSEARGTGSDRPRTLSDIAENEKLAVGSDLGSVLELMVLKVPNLSELSHALDAGLEIPTWIVRTPSKDYQAGWVMTRRNRDLKAAVIPKTGRVAAKVLGWPMESHFVNPANPDNPLIFANMGGGHRPAQMVEKSARTAKGKGYRADGSDDITEELKSVRGRAGGVATSARKAASSQENVGKARDKKSERTRQRAEWIHELRAEHLDPREISAIVGCTVRTVQRYLREDR